MSFYSKNCKNTEITIVASEALAAAAPIDSIRASSSFEGNCFGILISN
jgi:hypothetical protein